MNVKLRTAGELMTSEVLTIHADETLRAQLKLPAGVGLAVKHVEGPAKDAGVQQHDVLYKLNDQLLINTEQLVVLVRNFKPGDKVELTVIRQAQPVQLSATLVRGSASIVERRDCPA